MKRFLCGRHSLCAAVVLMTSKLAVAGPETEGQWGNLLMWPIEAVHCILLYDGIVLCATADEDDATEGTDETLRLIWFDPTAVQDAVTRLAEPSYLMPEYENAENGDKIHFFVQDTHNWRTVALRFSVVKQGTATRVTLVPMISPYSTTIQPVPLQVNAHRAPGL